MPTQRDLYASLGSRLTGAEVTVAKRAKLPFRDWLKTITLLERDTHGDVTGTRPWEWWDWHDALCEDLELDRLIILKARQLGVSWALAARRVWEAIDSPGYLAGVVSAGETEAAEFVAKCLHICTSTGTHVSASNQLEVRLANGGRILAFPSTPKAGRGFTFSTFTADEAAFHPWAGANYAAYSPATTGQIAIISSAGGDRMAVSDWFQRLWTAARDGGNRYTARFYPDSYRPGRDDAWRQAVRDEMSVTPGQFEREHPQTPEEAFRSMLRLQFDAAAIDDGRAYAAATAPIKGSATIPPVLQSQLVSIWAEPVPGLPYVIATDGAEGKGYDYTVTYVMESRTQRVVASIREHVLEQGEHGAMVAALARWYNDAWCIVERSHGEAILSQLALAGSKVYKHSEEPTMEQRLRGVVPRATVGFPTTAATRPGLIADLGMAIKARTLSCPDAAFWAECATFVVNESGRPEAAMGQHDDCVMAMALCVRLASMTYTQTVREVEPTVYQRQKGYSYG